LDGQGRNAVQNERFETLVKSRSCSRFKNERVTVSLIVKNLIFVQAKIIQNNLEKSTLYNLNKTRYLPICTKWLGKIDYL
jgi:hypothetical protein